MAGSLLLEKESDWEGALARFLRARCASNRQGEGCCGGLEDGGTREREGLECLLQALVGTQWNLFAGRREGTWHSQETRVLHACS